MIFLRLKDAYKLFAISTHERRLRQYGKNIDLLRNVLVPLDHIFPHLPLSSVSRLRGADDRLWPNPDLVKRDPGLTVISVNATAKNVKVQNVKFQRTWNIF